MTHPKAWFQLENSREHLTVHFLAPESSEWRPVVLRDTPLEGPFASRSVLLEGKAPLWMYAHAALRVKQAGAARILVYQPQQPLPVQVHPLPDEIAEVPAWMESIPDPVGGTIVRFLKHPEGGLWSPETLGALKGASKAWDTRLVTLSGPAPNWLYSAAACLAGELDARLVSYFSPREAVGILLNARPGEDVEMPPSPSLLPGGGGRGRVIGIVGDPNSGKSVFSILLEKGFQMAGITSLWRLDCDHAAPTPHWYLQMLAQNRKAQAKQMRESQKREWTPEAESSLRDQLKHCAASLDWVIADFPGGIHKPDHAERIPDGREILIGEADHLVILARRDMPSSVVGWQEALSHHGLDSRIIGIAESVDHTASLDLRLREGGLIRAEIDGLDRRSLSDSVLRAKLSPWSKLTNMIISRIRSTPIT